MDAAEEGMEKFSSMLEEFVRILEIPKDYQETKTPEEEPGSIVTSAVHVLGGSAVAGATKSSGVSAAPARGYSSIFSTLKQRVSAIEAFLREGGIDVPVEEGSDGVSPRVSAVEGSASPGGETGGASSGSPSRGGASRGGASRRKSLVTF